MVTMPVNREMRGLPCVWLSLSLPNGLTVINFMHPMDSSRYSTSLLTGSCGSRPDRKRRCIISLHYYVLSRAAMTLFTELEQTSQKLLDHHFATMEREC